MGIEMPVAEAFTQDYRVSTDPTSHPVIRGGTALASVYMVLVDPAQIGVDLSGWERHGVALKVLKAEPAEAPLLTRWGGRRGEGWDETPLFHATVAQNVAAWHGLAPRVYGVVTLSGPERSWAAQVVEVQYGLLDSGGSMMARARLDAALARYGITGCLRGSTKRDWVGGKFIDFQCCQVNEDIHVERLLERACEASPWRGSGGKPYQGIGPLTGARGDVARRAQCMGLSPDSFFGKTVIDLGCSTGAFPRFARQMGAQRTVGVDRPETVEVAFSLSNWTGHWNADWLGLDLQDEGWSDVVGRETGIDEFDVGFFLSMDRVCGYDDEVAACCRTLYVESHPGQRKDEWERRLARHWKCVDYLGFTEDRHKRWLWRCSERRF